jgi:hypothetical protein
MKYVNNMQTPLFYRYTIFLVLDSIITYILDSKKIIERKSGVLTLIYFSSFTVGCKKDGI